jgi:hypothetical protein
MIVSDKCPCARGPYIAWPGSAPCTEIKKGPILSVPRTRKEICQRSALPMPKSTLRCRFGHFSPPFCCRFGPLRLPAHTFSLTFLTAARQKCQKSRNPSGLTPSTCPKNLRATTTPRNQVIVTFQGNAP